MIHDHRVRYMIYDHRVRYIIYDHRVRYMIHDHRVRYMIYDHRVRYVYDHISCSGMDVLEVVQIFGTSTFTFKRFLACCDFP